MLSGQVRKLIAFQFFLHPDKLSASDRPLGQVVWHSPCLRKWQQATSAECGGGRSVEARGVRCRSNALKAKKSSIWPIGSASI
jgi:hypothetical protein